MKVLLLHNIFWSHYKASVFSALSAFLDNKNIDFQVIHFAQSELARSAMKASDKNMHQYQYEVLNKEHMEDWNSLDLFKELVRQVKDIKPDLVILPGINNLALILLTIYCRFRNIKMFNAIDSTEYDKDRKLVKRLFKKILFKAYSGVYCYGSPHKRYLESLGVDGSNIHVRIQASPKIFNVEPESFANKSIDFLFVGRISNEKNLEFALNAFSKLKRESNFYLIGEGPDKKYLENKFKSENIVFCGYKPLEELSYFYSKTKFFILPSRSETWGLVVNEAMMHRIPVLVSKHCGCSEDLIDGNGFVFNPYKEEELVKLFEKCLEIRQSDYLKMSNNSLQIIKKYTPENSARQMSIPIIQKILD